MRHLSVFGVALAVLGSGAGLPTAARATQVALPAASSLLQCITSTGVVTGVSSCAGPNDSASLTESPFASVQTSAFGEGIVDTASAFGVLDYSLEVVGGHAGDVVPLDVAAILEAMPMSGGLAFSELGVAADGAFTETICSSSCGAGTGVTSFNGVIQVDAVSGVIYTNAIHMEVEAGGAFGPPTDFNGGFASADPHIYIDPSDPNAAAYTVLLSPGIANGLPTIPEPGAWALMLLGIGALGGALRGRRWRRV